MFRLDGRIAIVTGASRGIGRQTAITLAQQGAFVFVNYVKQEAAALEVVDLIRREQGKAEAVAFDVSNSQAIEEAVQRIVRDHKRLDIAVSNAGIAQDGLFVRLKDEDLDKVLSVNLKGAVALARASIKCMMKERFGRVIFLSSVVGEMGNPGQAAYSMSKSALMGLSKTLAKEYASRSITVNVITPGFIETDMTAKLTDDQRAYMLKGIPLGRVGTASDVAASVAYLASDEAGYVTGQVLRVNGGLYV